MPRNQSLRVLKRARDARKELSVAERAMWHHLRTSKLGFRFKREHPIGPYRLDFYCHEALLCVEMDGEQHDPAKDAIRDRELAKHGILTYRVPNRRFFMMDPEPFRDDIGEIQRLCELRAGRSADGCPQRKPAGGSPSPPAPSPPEGRGGSAPEGRGGSAPEGRGGSAPEGRGGCTTL